jgi:hypothetical protein
LRIEIVIPTKGRGFKLLKCLGSIAEARKQVDCYLYTYIYFSDKDEFKQIDEALLKYPWIFTRLLEKEYNASEFWNDHLKECRADIFYYINDDVILAPDCLKNSIATMNKYFPDLDGVIGLYQENIPIDQQCRCAFGAIGSKFRDRFPNKQVFMPKYRRFYLDQELYEYSSKISKCVFDETAKLIHMHPSFNSAWMDETHKDVRKHIGKDKKLYDMRHKEGLIWGESFEI